MKYAFIVAVSVLVGFSSCTDGVICTEEFAMVAVEITGQEPTSHYTIQLSNGDTVYRNQKLTDELFLVLDDNFHKHLKNRSEQFQLHLYKNDSLLAIEPYTIAGDDCHIRLESGKRKIELK